MYRQNPQTMTITKVVVIFAATLHFAASFAVHDGLYACRTFNIVDCNTRQFPSSLAGRRSSRLFVRNIDLPECLIFYGQDTLREDGDLESLLQECHDTDTPVVVLYTDSRDGNGDNLQKDKRRLIYMPQQALPPHPYDLVTAIESITVQPRPFGGSAGFGSKQPDPPRSPMPARTVVFTSKIDQTRAARAAGMRVIAIASSSSSNDDYLADAVVDTIDFWLDDIATPGSFWLNPPHARDDEGNKVDVEDLMMQYENSLTASIPTHVTDNGGSEAHYHDADNDEDAQLRKLLADIDPL